jgi:hypothetical protein
MEDKPLVTSPNFAMVGGTLYDGLCWDEHLTWYIFGRMNTKSISCVCLSQVNE